MRNNFGKNPARVSSVRVWHGRTGCEHINVGEVVLSAGLHCGRDEENDCVILDEDKLCDALEPRLAQGGKIVDHHRCVMATRM